MVIHIHPNRINIPSGAAAKAGERRRLPAPAQGTHTRPTRADVNHVPAPESLMTLISSAVAALRQGITWDRGTILNLLV